ncbi:MAG: hydroxymethylpyrimidine/phosphomethylpyrimidine kinase [Gammaproteobacteria bacterium]|nr:hydroxymethylpyrimidine/phosphomethylpyrimidine kinase [Gammaproteobacteria bacterium]
MTQHQPPPVVLVFAGSDPTGGAGIEADILTLASLGCRAAPVITAITVQDTINVHEFYPVNAEGVISQARAILEDMPVAAIKTGMLAQPETIAAIATIVRSYPDIPLVVDPVLASGAGDQLSTESLEDAYRSTLLPLARLITPNSLEIRRLAHQGDSIDACAQELLTLGCDKVLVTGTHERTERVHHKLFSRAGLEESFDVERLPYSYHGSGCTLASACAAGFAHGIEDIDAIGHALHYTQQTLIHGYRPGMGQHLPHHFYWATGKPVPDRS